MSVERLIDGAPALKASCEVGRQKDEILYKTDGVDDYGRSGHCWVIRVICAFTLEARLREMGPLVFTEQFSLCRLSGTTLPDLGLRVYFRIFKLL